MIVMCMISRFGKIAIDRMCLDKQVIDRQYRLQYPDNCIVNVHTHFQALTVQ